jgi:hypothetical protein
MEITRVAPFPLTLTQDGFDPSTDYIVTILDSHTNDLSQISVTSNSSGEISTILPSYYSRYDDDYRIEIYVNDGDEEDPVLAELVFIDTLSIYRPYFDVSVLSDDDEEVQELKQYEYVAKSIIDSITGGFNYKRETVETVGLGNDYLPLPYRLNKIVKVIENNVIVFNSEDEESTNIKEYYITPDHSTISIPMPYILGGYNRLQSKPVVPQMPASDSFTLYNTNDSANIIQSLAGSPFFPSGWDYTVVVEAGWPIIPNDIKYCMRLLINDLKCDNLPYANAYISEYKSDQFSVKIEKESFSKNMTGNRIVDKILSAYVRPLYHIGIL